MTEPETKQEKLARLKKSVAKKENSLVVQVMESDWYDHNPGRRFVLLAITYSLRTNEDAWSTARYKDDMLGWCDMSQWKIGLRVGKSQVASSQRHQEVPRGRRGSVAFVGGRQRCGARHVPDRARDDREPPASFAEEERGASAALQGSSHEGMVRREPAQQKGKSVAAGMDEDE